METQPRPLSLTEKTQTLPSYDCSFVGSTVGVPSHSHGEQKLPHSFWSPTWPHGQKQQASITWRRWTCLKDRQLPRAQGTWERSPSPGPACNPDKVVLSLKDSSTANGTT